MKRLVILILVAAATAACAKLSLAPNQPASPGPPKVIWTGTSDGFAIRWTAGDITASPVSNPMRQAFSALGLTIYDFHNISRKQSADCDFVRVTQLESVVGPLVSIRDDDTMKCTNGATGIGRKVVAVDLTHPGALAALPAYFPAQAIAGLHSAASHACPGKLPDLDSRFAFVDVHGPDVTVQLTLPPDCKQSDASFVMPIPAKLRSWLELAAQGKQGFLARDQAKIAGGQTTTINYHYRLNGS
jgi:hypothetical protein